MTEYRSVSADYRLFSYILLGPRYRDNLKEFLEYVKDRPYYEETKKIYEILVSQDMDKLLTEYTSCFVNDFRELKCPPYESWYIQKTIYGSVLEKLMASYLKYGLNVQKELPDHVSTEMEFTSFLYFVSLDKEGDEFVSSHILRWVPKLANDIKENFKGEYTKLIGIALEKFMINERNRISKAKSNTNL
ncbi:MAG: TorD/DmsD family molecular chaperone [Nitrososphaeria archaeon]|jgi:TorA maturation chaperone TorD|nr:molecular chaperone TorD family protein [Conexivisphaerales archaeon]